MTETNFKELTFSLLGLIADGKSLSESVVWNMFAKYKSLQEVKTESDLFSLRNDVVNYREKLHFYIRQSYHNDTSITNKFFTDVVSTVRQSAATRAKVATVRGYVLRSGANFPIYIQNANTYAGAITLNINSTGAKTVYINGTVSSSSNYTLAAGIWNCYYNGTYYYLSNLPPLIEDSSTVTDRTWSSNKINTQINTKSIVKYNDTKKDNVNFEVSGTTLTITFS